MKTLGKQQWKSAALCGALVAALVGAITPVQARSIERTDSPSAAAPASVRATSDAAGLSLDQQFRAIRSGGNGASLASLQTLSPDASSLVAGSGNIVSRQSTTLPAENPWDFFVTPNGTLGDVDPGPAAQQVNFYSVGVLGGIDYRFSKNFTLGAYVGYDYTKETYKGSLSAVHDNATRFGLFSSWQDGTGDWLQGTVGGAYHSIQTRDDSGGLGTAINSGSTDGMELDSSLTYGHDFKVGAWTLTPTAGLDYIRLAVDGYTEAGPATATTFQNQNTNSLRSELGGTVAYVVRAGSVKWTPYLRAGWNHEFLDDTVNTQTGGIATTSFTTDQIGRDTATLGLGVSAALTSTVSWSLDYAGEIGSYYQSHTFDTAVHVAF